MPYQLEVPTVSHFAFAAQLCLGIVFLFSSLSKLRHPSNFARSVVEYEILPATFAYVFALTLILVEVFLAIAFLTGWLIDIALPLAVVTFMVFAVAVGINIQRDRKVPCGCFGNSSERISARTLARLLLLTCVVLLLLALRSTGVARLPNVSAMAFDISTLAYLLQIAFLATSLALLARWILSLPELLFLARSLRRSQSPPSDKKDNGRMESA